MPLFEYECKECNYKSEYKVTFKEAEEGGPECPQCKIPMNKISPLLSKDNAPAFTINGYCYNNVYGKNKG